jgi:hypothetical protein
VVEPPCDAELEEEGEELLAIILALALNATLPLPEDMPLPLKKEGTTAMDAPTRIMADPRYSCQVYHTLRKTSELTIVMATWVGSVDRLAKVVEFAWRAIQCLESR